SGGVSGGGRGDLRGHVERRYRVHRGTDREASGAARAVRHAAAARADSWARSLVVECGSLWSGIADESLRLDPWRYAGRSLDLLEFYPLGRKGLRHPHKSALFVRGISDRQD